MHLVPQFPANFVGQIVCGRRPILLVVFTTRMLYSITPAGGLIWPRSYLDSVPCDTPSLREKSFWLRSARAFRIRRRMVEVIHDGDS